MANHHLYSYTTYRTNSSLKMIPARSHSSGQAHEATAVSACDCLAVRICASDPRSYPLIATKKPTAKKTLATHKAEAKSISLFNSNCCCSGSTTDHLTAISGQGMADLRHKPCWAGLTTKSLKAQRFYPTIHLWLNVTMESP